MDDVSGILKLAQQVYPPFDIGGTAFWIHTHLSDPAVAMFTTGNAVAIASYMTTFFWPDRKVARLNFLFGAPGSAFRLYRCLEAAVGWAQAQGCYQFEFDSMTNIDLWIFARKLGADVASPFYRVRL